jgi:hypothetical protein
VPIVPDTKSWTWVLERACPDCGFDTSTFPREDVGRLIRENAAAWPAVLANPAARQRPSDDVWSALEYGCHVRDVFRLYDMRLRRMLTEDNPTYENWDQDTTAIEDHYDAQDPAVVAPEIERAASALADRFDGVHGQQWQRTGTRSDGARFTVDSFGRYLIHDPVHHLWDVEQGLDRLAR